MATDGWVQGAAWTTRTARVTTTNAGNMFAFAGNAAGARGAAGSTVLLVTPARVNVFGLAFLPAFSRMSYTFVPEPGPIGLVGAGLAGLALAARSRGRR